MEGPGIGKLPKFRDLEIFDAMCKLIQMLQKGENKANAEMGKDGKSWGPWEKEMKIAVL